MERNDEAVVAMAARDDVVCSTDAEQYVIATTFGDGRHITEIKEGAEAGAYVEAMRRSGAAPVVFAFDAIAAMIDARVRAVVAAMVAEQDKADTGAEK